MRRGKVLIVSTSPFPYGDNITDGPGFRAWNLFQQLSERNEIVILSLYDSFHLTLPQERELVEGNIRVKCVSHRPSRVASLIEAEQPDSLYLPWSSTPFLSRLKKKIPTIIDYVGPGLLEAYATHGYVPIPLLHLKLRSFWLGDFFMTAGKRERYYLYGLLAASKRLSFPQREPKGGTIHHIPMTPPKEAPSASARYDRDDSKPLSLLLAGALLPWYNYEVFFESLRFLLRRGQRNFQFVMMGGNPRDPKFETAIKSKAHSNEIVQKITYTGLVPFKKRFEYYQQADAMIILPSNPLEDELSVRTRIVDSLWAGLPIITPARDEYSELALQGGAGFGYRSDDPTSMAETIDSLIVNRNRLFQARKQTQKVLEENFAPPKFIEPLNRFLDNPTVDTTRSSPNRFAPDLYLWFRDSIRMLR